MPNLSHHPYKMGHQYDRLFNMYNPAFPDVIEGFAPDSYGSTDDGMSGVDSRMAGGSGYRADGSIDCGNPKSDLETNYCNYIGTNCNGCTGEPSSTKQPVCKSLCDCPGPKAPTPAQPKPTSPSTSGTYTVVSGDTCSKISGKKCKDDTAYKNDFCSYTRSGTETKLNKDTIDDYCTNKLQPDDIINYNCGGCSKTPPTPAKTLNVCGTDYNDAANNCSKNKRCPSGQDDECDTSQSCQKLDPVPSGCSP